MTEEKKRIHLLDLWRSLAIVCMVWYHYLYNLAAIGVVTWTELFSMPISLLQIFSSYSFILLSGISSHLSRSNLKRGSIVLGWSVAVSAVTIYIGEPILFGILHFLGVCMVIYGLLGKYIKRVKISPIIWLFFFIVAKIWMDGARLVNARFLFPLGFRYAGFRSADYYPLLPWVFLFLLGTRLGGVLTERRDEWNWLYTPVPRVLTWAGRNSLVVYLAHQPIIIALLYMAGLTWHP